MRRQHGRRQQQYRPMGELPYGRDVPGPINDPGADLIPEWINNYTATIISFTAGVVSAQIIPANPLRVYVLVQNKNAASDMFINFGTAASAVNSITIIPRGNYELIGGANGGPFSPMDSIHMLGAVAAMQGAIVEGVLPPVSPRY